MQSRRSLLPQLLAAGAFAAGFLQADRGAAQSDRAVAREFIGIDGWLNTAAPLAPFPILGEPRLSDHHPGIAAVLGGGSKPGPLCIVQQHGAEEIGAAFMSDEIASHAQFPPKAGAHAISLGKEPGVVSQASAPWQSRCRR